LDARLGAGAMGEVWRARHPSHATPFAVKLLSTGGQGDEGALWMEVRAIAALNHPGIVSIHDCGALAAPVSLGGAVFAAGTPWFAMDHAPLGSLEGFCPSDWGELRGVLLEVLEALAF